MKETPHNWIHLGTLLIHFLVLYSWKFLEPEQGELLFFSLKVGEVVVVVVVVCVCVCVCTGL